MRVIIQRVSQASVEVDHKIVGQINRGFLILLGVGMDDSLDDIEYLVRKIVKMRIFNDEQGKINLDLSEIKGECLVISQFTLYASTKKGNRPSFTGAAIPEIAKSLYQKFCIRLSQELASPIQTGIFAADMKVSLVNDGPVTLIVDSKDRE